MHWKTVQFSRSVVSDSLRPHECSTPGLPVHHQLPEFTQTHAHRVSDAIQPSHPLSSPSPPTPKSLPASGSFPMSQFFAWGGQSIGVSASASVLPVNTQDWSPLVWTGWISLLSKDRGNEKCPLNWDDLLRPKKWDRQFHIIRGSVCSRVTYFQGGTGWTVIPSIQSCTPYCQGATVTIL